MSTLGRVKTLVSSGHILALILLQIIIIILFALFVRYNPKSAQRSILSIQQGNAQMKDTYGMFQDVHIMIFIGIGFLYTFLKKYSLSSVSLNLLCGALSIQVFTLVNGVAHPSCVNPLFSYSSSKCPSSWPYIDIDVNSMMSADFAIATFLISFGVVLGVTSPLQLIIMAVLETMFYVLNDTIGRTYIGAVDIGCTIFIHLFAAVFGLAVARVLYKPEQANSMKEGSSYQSDLFAMVGTVFLWAFWPSFNGGTAPIGDAQQRAVVNTYFSLCSCVLATFAFSALITPTRKFDMVHIQNATLAGGVAVGTVGTMMLTPSGAIVVGAVAGVLAVCGITFVQPFLLTKLKIHDTCGVNNLHGIPGLFGGLVSVLLAGIATHESYDKFAAGFDNENSSLIEIFPALAAGGTALGQALSQFLAICITVAVAVVGGLVTGLVLLMVGRKEGMDLEDYYNDDWNIHDVEAKSERAIIEEDLMSED